MRRHAGRSGVPRQLFLAEQSNSPWFAKRLGPQAIGLLVVDEFILLWIVLKLAIQEDRNVGRMACDVRITRDVCIGTRLAARLNTVQGNRERGRLPDSHQFLRLCDRQVSSGELSTNLPLSPVSIQPSSPSKANGARTQWNPAVFADDQFDAIRVPRGRTDCFRADSIRPVRCHPRCLPIGKDRHSVNPIQGRHHRPCRRLSRS